MSALLSVVASNTAMIAAKFLMACPLKILDKSSRARIVRPRLLTDLAAPGCNELTFGGIAAACRSGRAIAGQVFQASGYERSPAGLMAGAQAASALAVKMLVKEDLVAPFRTLGIAPILAIQRALPACV